MRLSGTAHSVKMKMVPSLAIEYVQASASQEYVVPQSNKRNCVRACNVQIRPLDHINHLYDHGITYRQGTIYLISIEVKAEEVGVVFPARNLQNFFQIKYRVYTRHIDARGFSPFCLVTRSFHLSEFILVG